MVVAFGNPRGKEVRASRGRRRIDPRLFLLLPMLLISGCRPVGHALTAAHLPCGLYRWPAKTLADPGAGDIRTTPIDTTIRHLAYLHRPKEIHRKTRAPNEYYVYRVQAVLFAVRPMVDQDLHLLLRDPLDPDVRMLAEIPSPACTAGSGMDDEFARARQVARSLKGRREEVFVEITGVGFFDVPHKHGGARNGFELHPVLELLEVQNARR